MARRIEYQGRIIEVPDDATDDEVAQIIEASMGAGATPTAPSVPAGPVTPTRPDQISVTPRTVDRGFFGELLGSLNPIEMGKNVAGTWGPAVLKMAATPFLQSEDGEDDGSADPPFMADVPPVLPDLPGIYREAQRRGNANESTAGMWGNATGQALLAGLGLGASRLIRSAPKRAAAAEADYAAATGADPATAKTMMDRGIVVRDAPAQAAAAASKSSELAGWRNVIPNPKGKLTSTGLEMDAGNTAIANTRAGLATEAQFQQNLATILEALPEDPKVGAAKVVRAVRRTGGTALLGGALTGIPHSITLPVAAGLTIADVATQLTKTHMWKTAAPLYRYRFMNAVLKGDANTAASVGALIASGQASSTTAPTATAPTHTATAPAAAPQRSQSNTRTRQSPPQGPGSGPPGITARFDPDNPEPMTAPQHPNEFSGGGVRSENADLIETVHPSLILPKRFKTARSQDIGMPLEVGGLGSDDWGGMQSIAWEKSDLGQETTNNIAVSRESNEYASTLMHEIGHAAINDGDLSEEELNRFRKFYDEKTARRLLEIEIANYVIGDLSTAAFSSLQRAIADPYAKKLYDRYRAMSPEELEVASNELKDRFYGDPSIPSAAKYYGRDYRHAMAELFGQFVANPREFKKRYPDWYAQFVPIFGREYTDLSVAEKAMMRQRGPTRLTPFEKEKGESPLVEGVVSLLSGKDRRTRAGN